MKSNLILSQLLLSSPIQYYKDYFIEKSSYKKGEYSPSKTKITNIYLKQKIVYINLKNSLIIKYLLSIQYIFYCSNNSIYNINNNNNNYKNKSVFVISIDRSFRGLFGYFRNHNDDQSIINLYPPTNVLTIIEPKFQSEFIEIVVISDYNINQGNRSGGGIIMFFKFAGCGNINMCRYW